MAERDPLINQAESAPEKPSAASLALRDTARAVTTPLAVGIGLVATLVGLILLAWSVLFITKGRFLKHPFERIVSKMTNRDVHVAGDFQLYFNPIHTKFYAEGLTVSNPAWASKKNFFEADKVDTEIATLTFLFGHRRINWLDLEGGHIDAEWNANHTQNTWTFSDKPAEPFHLPLIRAGQVAGTQIRYRDQKMQLFADINIDTVKATDNRFANAVRFSGGGTARHYPFRLSGALLSPNATLAGGSNQLSLHVEAVRSVADVTGTLPGATDIEGADLHLDVRGRNLADIFQVAGIAVPETRNYRIRSNLTKVGDEWRFTKLVGRFGDSDIGGTMTVAMIEPRMKLTANLATRRLSILDVGPFIGYAPNALANKGITAAVAQTGGTPRILPDAPLNVEALKNFDADVHYTVRDITGRDIPISNVDLTLGLENSLLKLSPLTFDMAGGHLASDISIDAQRKPVFTDYDIRLSPTPMGVLLKGYGVEASGTTGVLKARVKMTGSGDTVRDSLATSNGRIAVILPRGTFWTRNIQLTELDIGVFLQKLLEKKLKDPVQINCGLIGFTVRDGVASADPILIDTESNVMLGKGAFSFRDESIDLSFRADAKKFSLFSGQSPVAIGGHFVGPKINPISPQLITRGGVGLGLAVAVNPLAALLAFVDPGDAKSADCGPVLAGASARAQRTSKGQPRKDVGTGTPKKK